MSTRLPRPCRRAPPLARSASSERRRRSKRRSRQSLPPSRWALPRRSQVFRLPISRPWTVALLGISARLCTTQGSSAIADVPSICCTDPASAVLRRARRACECRVLTVDICRSAGCECTSCARRDLQQADRRLPARSRRSRARCPSRAPTTGYDDVKQMAAGAAAGDEHSVDSGGLGAVRAEARAGGADDGCRRCGRRAAVDPGAARRRGRSPLEEISGNIRAAGAGTVERTAASRLLALMMHDCDPPWRGRVPQRAAARLRARARNALFSLRFDAPSKCAALLHESAIDVGMIPSIEFLRGHEPYRIVPRHAASSSDGPVASVALFSTNAASSRLRTIAADTSSRTSNALLRILCVERFGIDPEFVPMAPDSSAMLQRCDAALHHRRPGAVSRSRRRRACRRSTSARSGPR